MCFSFLWAVLLLDSDPKGLWPNKEAVRKGKIQEEINVWSSLVLALDSEAKGTRKK